MEEPKHFPLVIRPSFAPNFQDIANCIRPQLQNMIFLKDPVNVLDNSIRVICCTTAGNQVLMTRVKYLLNLLRSEFSFDVFCECRLAREFLVWWPVDASNSAQVIFDQYNIILQNWWLYFDNITLTVFPSYRIAICIEFLVTTTLFDVQSRSRFNFITITIITIGTTQLTSEVVILPCYSKYVFNKASLYTFYPC